MGGRIGRCQHHGFAKAFDCIGEFTQMTVRESEKIKSVNVSRLAPKDVRVALPGVGDGALLVELDGLLQLE